RNREIRRLRVRTLEHRLGGRVVAGLQRGPRPDQRGYRRRKRNGERFLRKLPCLAVTSFEQRDDRRILLVAEPLELPAAAAFAHVFRQSGQAHRRADQRVERDEPQDGDEDESVLRQLDAVGRGNEQHVSRIETEQQRERDRRRGDQQERDERA